MIRIAAALRNLVADVAQREAAQNEATKKVSSDDYSLETFR